MSRSRAFALAALAIAATLSCADTGPEPVLADVPLARLRVVHVLSTRGRLQAVELRVAGRDRRERTVVQPGESIAAEGFVVEDRVDPDGCVRFRRDSQWFRACAPPSPIYMDDD